MFSAKPKDTWNRDYEELVELGAQIGMKIRERDENSSDAKLNQRVDKLLQDYQKKLRALKTLHEKLQAQDYTIRDDTFQQRDGMIEDLDKKYEHLRRCYNKGWSAPRYESTRIEPWSSDIPTASVLRREHDEIILEQDKGLEGLSQGLRRQQRIARDMQTEIKDQNVVIDDIKEHAPKTETKIIRQTRNVQHMRRKDSCYCTCDIRHKKPPKRLPRRPNDIYINRTSLFEQQLARSHRLLEQSFDNITIHGLGMAIHRAINLALQLQETSPYQLQLSATTSTVQLVDEMEPLHDEDDFHSESRPCSAVHIHLVKTLSSSSSSSSTVSSSQLPPGVSEAIPSS